jgi:hypothetical protein
MLIDPAWSRIFRHGRYIDMPAAIAVRPTDADSPDWAIVVIDRTDPDLACERAAAKRRNWL